MSIPISPSQSAVQAALWTYLTSILPAGMPIVEGQDNRVAAPSAADYAVITYMRQERIETNNDAFVDVSFQASLAGNTLTVLSINFGKIVLGSTLFGPNVPIGVTITSGPTGGGTGTYQTTGPTATVSTEKMAAGNEQLTQNVKMTFEVQVFGPNSGDNVTTITTLLRDDQSADWWVQNYGTAQGPLYATDPRQIPFEDENQQIEDRWITEVEMQANVVVTVPQQFADQLKVSQPLQDTILYPA